MSTSQHAHRSTFLGALCEWWLRLTEPVPAVTDPELRFKARWFATALVALIPLAYVAAIAYPPASNPTLLILTLLLPALGLLPVLMCRQGHFNAAVVLASTVASVEIAALAVLFSRPVVLHYLLLPLLFSTVVLPVVMARLTIIANAALILFTRLQWPDLFPTNVVGETLVFFALGAALAAVCARYRDGLEQVHTSRLIESNAALRQEIASREKAEAALLTNEEKFRSHFEQINDIVFVLAPDFTLTSVTPSLERHLGYKPEALIGRNLRDLPILDPTYASIAVAQAAQILAGEHVPPRTCEFVARDGTRWIGEVSSSPGFHGHEIISLIAVVRDVTERSRVEERLRVSLTEKEVLLKEIHHRVKNNLQIVSSLLNLQSDSTPSRQTAALIHESQNRIRAMALIHERLYSSEDLTRITMADYLHDLVHHLFGSYRAYARGIRPDLAVSEVCMNIDTAIPCGLIINELVSNALKHAFPDGRQGEVQVRLQAAGANGYILTVADNGVGLPADLESRDSRSLGLQLVRSLVQQLDGKLAVERADGAAFTITFQESVPTIREQ